MLLSVTNKKLSYANRNVDTVSGNKVYTESENKQGLKRAFNDILIQIV